LVVSIADELPFLATASRNQRRVHGAPQSGTQTAPKTTKKAPKPGRTRTSRGNHPDPGVIVDIGTVSGASQAELQKQLRARGYTPFRACYEEGLRRNQQLTGRVSVEFTLGAEGTAQNAFKASSTLADESVNQCVVRETTLIALPRPQTGTPTVPMQVTFAVGDAPVRVPRPVNHADKLRETLRTKWAAVEACYQTGLERRKNLGGRLELRLRLKGTDIVEANEADTHFADADVSRCVATSYRSLKVAKVAKGEISVIYPLHLETIALRPTSQ
jgi:hypothetical protein